MRPHRVRMFVLASAALLMTACGTELPNSAFQQVGTNGGQVLQGSQTGTGTGSSTGTGGTTQTVTGGTQGTKGTNGTQGHGGGGSTTSNTVTGHTKPSTCGGSNTASDRGVSASTITVGNIVSKSGVFGPTQFTVSYWGASAFFDALNAAGGVCGRQIRFITCDDGGSTSGNTNCVHTLIDQDKVFAFVANNIYQYAGAQYVSQQDVPDVGGEPISGLEYYTYPHLYAVLGSFYMNNGQPPSSYYENPGLGFWFHQHLGITKAAVVYYSQKDSERGANEIEAYLKAAGIKVDPQPVELGLPNFNAAVVNMQGNGDQAVFDALDTAGNQGLCQAMQNNNWKPKAKVSTISTWNQQLGTNFNSFCQSIYYATGNSTNYGNTNDPQVAQFRSDFARYWGSEEQYVSQWSLEGYAAAMWFTDALKSCGANVTRSCVEKFVNTPSGYGAAGLLDTHTTYFPHISSFAGKTTTQCFTIVKWSQSAGTWVEQADHHSNCYTEPFTPYQG